MLLYNNRGVREYFWEFGVKVLVGYFMGVDFLLPFSPLVYSFLKRISERIYNLSSPGGTHDCCVGQSVTIITERERGFHKSFINLACLVNLRLLRPFSTVNTCSAHITHLITLHQSGIHSY